tara:strand:+ start:2666 stop:3607 length:942 start_codon:yes stop_codon:yes gene_type:complete
MLQNQNIIHIGLPKCGSTFLQKKIFKNIKDSKFQYYENFDDIKHNINDFSKNLINKANHASISFSKKNLVISNERLSGFCPSNYYYNADQNLKFFTKNNHIIIVIRKPTEFISSCYVNMIHTNNIFLDPEQYFKNDDYSFSKNKKFFIKKFNLNYFDYNKLIQAYKSKFNNVSVIKFENLFDELNFFEKININEIKIEKKFFSNNKENISPGIFYVNSMKFTFNLISFFFKYTRLAKVIEIIFKKNFYGDTLPIEYRLSSFVVRKFRLNKLYYFISTNILKKKYSIEFKDKNFQEKMKSLEEEYANLPPVINY